MIYRRKIKNILNVIVFASICITAFLVNTIKNELFI